MRRIAILLMFLGLLAGCTGAGRPGAAGAGAALAGTGALAAGVPPQVIPFAIVAGGILGWFTGSDPAPPPDCVFDEEIETDAAIVGDKEAPQAGNHYRLVRCSRGLDRDAPGIAPVGSVTLSKGEPSPEPITSQAAIIDPLAWHKYQERLRAEREQGQASGDDATYQKYLNCFSQSNHSNC
jgi:hypothetical protein